MNLSIPLNNGDELMLVAVPVESYAYGLNNAPMIGEKVSQSWKVHFQFQRTDNTFLNASHQEIDTGLALSDDPSILGTYDGEIDFEVKEEWVKCVVNDPPVMTGILRTQGTKLFQNYQFDLPQPVDVTYVRYQDSFFSLLRSETAKAFPKFDNPLDDYSESLTMPPKFAVILIHKR